MIIRKYSCVRVLWEEKSESEAVRLALVNLRRDLMRVLDCHVNEAAMDSRAHRLYVGTVNALERDGLLWREISEKADLSGLRDEDGGYRKEAFLIREREGELFIVGTDRRGTIYGIYDFCEWLGVSPWYFFADVPVRRREEAVIPEGFCRVDYPSVEYRGIFINDEEELEHWVQRYMGEETIGVRTYEKIFELLLRLKLNYIWPAMHVNSFNLRQENGALADRMGIVVGTSHCDMLMRSNNREWRPWLQRKGYTAAEYDFSVPGRNREILEEYWRESVEQNQDFEVSYTLGMRGIHDSGFETRSLAGLSKVSLRHAKIELLESVIDTQRRILKSVLDKRKDEGRGYDDTVKIFVPYKEVLELYDNGLRVPEELTLIWTNDNYGYVRRYPGEQERKRSGGNGIYFHNSYWAPPGASYLFISSIPLAHTRNELKKAWQEGIRRLWVTNFGAIKPLEQQLSFYARLAWEVGREDALTDREEDFLRQWLDGMFSGSHGDELAPLLTEFDQLTNVRKLEHMDSDVFSQTAYGDEAAARLHRYEEFFNTGNRIYEELPEAERDAFFQLVLMRLHAAYFTYSMYYYADRSSLCVSGGRMRAAAKYVQRCREFDHARRKMLHYYNRVMANGKWDGILTPEDFPPPRTAMHPAAVPPLAIGPSELIVTCWNEQKELHFASDGCKWIELDNAGEGEIAYRLTMPDWLRIADGDREGTVAVQRRILLYSAAGEAVSGELTAEDLTNARRIVIPVSSAKAGAGEAGKNGCVCAVEDGGRLCVEAEEAAADGWKLIPHLGRGRGQLAEAVTPGARLSFRLKLSSEGVFLLELHRFPTLNSTGRIRVGVSVDGGEVSAIESTATDEHRGYWRQNILNNVDKLYLELPFLNRGVHEICFTAVDRYFSFSRFVIYTRPRRQNSLGYTGEDQRLPAEIDIERFAGQFYGPQEPGLRPLLYLPLQQEKDTLVLSDIIVPRETLAGAAKTITPSQLFAAASRPVEESAGALTINAASALAQTDYAHTVNGPWQYCCSESFMGTGLAMLIRQEGLQWEDISSAPALTWRIRTDEGRYRIWVLLWMWGTDSSHFALGIDGRVIEEQKLYGGCPIWRYANEQVWKWVPVWSEELAAGEHDFSIYCLSSRLRFDKIYITKGEELPEMR